MATDARYRPRHKALTKDDLRPRDLSGKLFPSLDAGNYDKRLARQLESYADIITDLNVCLSALGLTSRIDPRAVEVTGALSTQFIISYGRIFVRAKGRAVQPQPNAHWIPNGESGMKIHKQLMEYRMQIIAHAGVSPLRGQSCFLIVDSEEKPKVAYDVYSASSTFNGILREHVPGYVRYISGMLKMLHDRRKEASSKLLQIASERFAANQ
jgi:hypothetical protein